MSQSKTAKHLVLSLAISAWSISHFGCAVAKSRVEASAVEDRTPAQAEALDAGMAGWDDEDSRELRRAHRVQRRALKTVKDYTLSDEFSSDVEILMADAFYKALSDLDAKTDEEVKKLILDEVERIEKVRSDNPDLPIRTLRVIKHYTRDLRRVADSANVKESLRKSMMMGWQRTKEALFWGTSWLAYSSATVAGVATFPLYGLGKFVVGAVRGEKLSKDVIKSDKGIIGDRSYEGFMFVSGSTATTGLIFQTMLLSTGLSPVFLGIQVVNSLTALLACGGALEGDPRADRVCRNLKKIYAFFTHMTDWSALGGVKVHKYFEKHLPIVIRRKHVVSTAVCKNDKHSLAVARRVHMRHEASLLQIEGIEAVTYGPTPHHPVSPTCASILIKVKADVDPEEIEAITGRVIDGLYIEISK